MLKWESKGIKMYKYKGKRENKNINLPKYNQSINQ